jgi:hypothetical protein
MDAAGLKNSAREQCLSAFVKERLHLATRKALRWTPTDPADWAMDARLLLEHPLYQRFPRHLSNALNAVVDEGVFFRGAKTRREGNYWFPGLNGGLPYVPKSDPVHEATYLFHDVMHHLMPDLLFDGVDSVDHRRVYIAWRMISEAVSLVLADMGFAASLATRPEHADYDFSKRRILPLFQSLPAERRSDLRWLTHEMVRFVLLGDEGALNVSETPWRAFAEKYSRFFVADFQWTRMNWRGLVAREGMARGWVELLRPETFRAQGLLFTSDVVARLGRSLPIDELVERLFSEVWHQRIAPALTFKGTPDVERSTSRGFRRWLTGQLAFFPRYAPLLGTPALAHELAARVRDPREFSAEERAELRTRFGDAVRVLGHDGVLSEDDASMFPDLFPLFDPYFLRDYDQAQQEFATVAEASHVAFA